MKQRIGVLTSGGDAPGMNATVRAVVRTAVGAGADVYGIQEGYQGLLSGHFVPVDWHTMSGILRKGGTVLGTARCPDMLQRSGRLDAAANLVSYGIDRLVVVGGDGSLTGAELLRSEWSGLLGELVQSGRVCAEALERHPRLVVVGLPGSIDNDLCGTDMTIGADTALHRTVFAVDCIFSTAASHQRTFVVEVMGRHCGYLALMTAVATGAEWLLIPENPPEADDWEQAMCEVLKAGREVGRRASIVIVAEGACDRHGDPITSDYVSRVLTERMGEEARVTILGHVQRGGRPSAFDRTLASVLGYAAAHQALESSQETSYLIGLKGNRAHREPLERCVKRTWGVAGAIAEGNFQAALELRGPSFAEALEIVGTLVRARPCQPAPGQLRRRIAILTAGGPAPGMNMAVRAAVRLILDRGHLALGVRRGFRGLMEDKVEELGWMSVTGWAPEGGSELGISRHVPSGRDLYEIARCLEDQRVDGLLVIGGWDAYAAVEVLHRERERFPVFDLPIVCLPASIDNNLPGSELSVGADTALNNIMDALDKIKASAVASERCFLVEVMGDYCGYLALLSGMAAGAEKVYLHELGITTRDLLDDLARLRRGFEAGRRVGLFIHNERAHNLYDIGFVAALFQEEAGGQFDVRRSILGHLQQGGTPTPFDRIQAVRMAARCVHHLLADEEPRQAFLGAHHDGFEFFDFRDFSRMVDAPFRRPKKQWWLELRKVADALGQNHGARPAGGP